MNVNHAKFKKKLDSRTIQGNYLIYVLHVSHIVSWRFTILLLGEIERQLLKAPLAAAIPVHILMHPATQSMRKHSMKPEIEIDHHTVVLGSLTSLLTM